MRTCMYCGKELEKGEVCDCPQSAARRGEASPHKTDTQENKGADNKQTRTSYKTGYAGGDNRFERARDKYKAKRAAKKNAASAGAKGFFSDLWRYVVSVIKNPVEAITNPIRLGKGAMLLISAAAGVLMWLCVFFIMRGGVVGPFRLLASAMSFAGTEGYRLLGQIGLCILTGAFGGVVIFFIYTGIFYLINRFIMRMKTPYWDFCIRLAAAWIPFALICLIGTVLSILSPMTLAALVICGAVTVAVLTYEALKTEWFSYSPSKVMLSMVLGYFVFFTIMAHLALI